MKAAPLVALLALATACQLMPLFDEVPGKRCEPGDSRETPCGICEAGTGFEVCGEDGRWRPPLLCEGNRYDQDDDGVAGAACFAEGRSCCGSAFDCDDSCPTCLPGGTDLPGNLLDEDCSGSPFDVDGDGFSASEDGGDDCDDSRADRHPGHDPICGDGLDHDCDGLADELGGCGACQATGLTAAGELGGFLSRGLFVSGEVAYVAADEGLRVVGLADPAAPALLAEVETGPARAVFREADRLYVTTTDALLVLDLADPEAPALLDRSAPVERARDLFVAEGLAYVVGFAGLFVFDVSHPEAEPLLLGADETAGASSLFVAGDRAVLGGPERCAGVLDVSDPAAPRPLFGAEVYGQCDGDELFVAAERVFVASASLVPGLHELGLGDDGLEPLSEPARTGSSRSVFVAGERAYVAAEGGLFLVDVSRPAAPVVVLSAPSSALPRAVFVSGELALLGTEAGVTASRLECPR